MKTNVKIEPGMQSDWQKTPQIALRPGIGLPGESFWSVSHKICYLNALSGRAYAQLIPSKNPKRCQTMSMPDGSRQCIFDLRFGRGYDLDRIADDIGADGEWVSRATFDAVSHMRVMSPATCYHLRFCPICIEGGYHWTVFQLSEETHCCVHRERLLQGCPKCGRAIPYALPRWNVPPFTCKCGYGLWLGASADVWSSDFNWTAQREHWDAVAACFKVRACPWFWYMDGRSAAGKRIVRHIAVPTRGERVLWRTWTEDVVLARRRRYLGNGDYSAGAGYDEMLAGKFYAILRKIERMLVRWVRRASPKSVPSTSIEGWLYGPKWAKLPNAQRALFMWRTYWYGLPYKQLRSFRVGEAFNTEFCRRKNHVYSRFREHSRVLRPGRNFTVADHWAQTHLFAMISAESFRFLLRRSPQATMPFRATCFIADLERMNMPFLILSQTRDRKKTYELRLWSFPNRGG